MEFIQRHPASPLNLFVESLWLCRSARTPNRLERVLPSPAPQLIVNLAEDQTRVYRETDHGLRRITAPGSILSGASSRAQIIDSDEQTYVAGVAFRPGGILPFVSAPADCVLRAMLNVDSD